MNDKEDRLSASVTVMDSSPWFSGHFPGDPILPGVAQLKMVAELIAASKRDGFQLSSLSRVKFRKIVRPGNVLHVQVTGTDKKNQYVFRITSGDEEVCSGRMIST